MQRNDIGVAELMAGGFGLLRAHPKAVAIWTVLYVLLMVPMLALMQPFSAAMANNAALANQGPLAPPVSALPTFPTELLGPLALVYLGFLLAFIAIFAAAVRAVTRGGGDAFGFLRFGLDELRLVALTLLYILALIMFEVALILVVVVASGAAQAVGTATAIAVGVVLGIGVLCLAVWLQIRLSLASAMTVMRGQFAIGESWRATRGHFWALFGTYALLAIGYLAVTGIIISLTNPTLIAAYGGGMKPDAMQQAMRVQANELSAMSPALIVRYLLTAVFGVAMFSVIFGVAATAAREFSRDRLEGVF